MAEKKTKPVSMVREKAALKYDAGSLVTSKEIASLQKAIAALSAKVKKMEERLKIVETALPIEKAVILRAISREQAEKEICNLFAKGGTLYYSDIAEKLNLDLELVVNVCHELQKRGEIKVDDNALQPG